MLNEKNPLDESEQPESHVAGSTSLTDSNDQAVSIVSGPWNWTSYATDQFLARNMSRFRQAEVPDRQGLALESQSWLSTLALRSMFVAVPTGTVATYGFLFVRRSAAAARSYEQARLATFDFLLHRRADAPGLSRYATATDHWEVFIAHAHQALTLLAAAIEQRGKLFTKGENSVLERLHYLHSDAKHADSPIQNGASAAEAGFTCGWRMKACTAKTTL
jgi:hypothetical protein